MSVNFYKLMRRLQWGTHLGLAGGKRVKNKLTDILLMTRTGSYLLRAHKYSTTTSVLNRVSNVSNLTSIHSVPLLVSIFFYWKWRQFNIIHDSVIPEFRKSTPIVESCGWSPTTAENLRWVSYVRDDFRKQFLRQSRNTGSKHAIMATFIFCTLRTAHCLSISIRKSPKLQGVARYGRMHVTNPFWTNAEKLERSVPL